jgi:Rieske Fe-S protein
MTDVQTTAETEHQAPCEAHAAQDGTGTRRAVLAGAGALGATCFLAACGTGTNSPSSTGGANPLGTDYQKDPAPAGSGAANAQGGGTNGGGNNGGIKLAAVEEVPVGGGVIKGKFVVTQPTKGTFKAFSSVCPHQGCNVNEINDGQIICPCHQSRFSVKDGSVKGGPAPRPLTNYDVKVSGGNIITTAT